VFVAKINKISMQIVSSIHMTAIFLAKADALPLSVRHINVTAMIIIIVFSLPLALANWL